MVEEKVHKISIFLSDRDREHHPGLTTYQRQKAIEELASYPGSWVVEERETEQFGGGLFVDYWKVPGWYVAKLAATREKRGCREGAAPTAEGVSA